MAGLLQLVQLLLSVICGIFLWATVIGKALVIVSVLLIVVIIYKVGKLMGEKHNGK